MRRYLNPHLSKIHPTLWDFCLWKIGFYRDAGQHLAAPAGFRYPASGANFEPSKPSATWVGHSTYWIDCKGYTFLTDPVWGQYCSPVPMRMFQRRVAPSLTLAELPKVDAVLLSHNHYDHLDADTVLELQRLQPQILWFVPKGVSRWFHKRGIRRTIELQWWETFEEGGIRVTAVPAQHFSGRSIWDRNRSLWNGYVLERDGKSIYFVGDTGYNPYDFKNIGAKFGGFDLSLIPIGSYLPRRFMSPVHCDPYDGVKIHIDVRSKLSLGMHWNTFQLSEEPFDRPPYDLYLAMQEKNLPFDTFLPIDIGNRINW